MTSSNDADEPHETFFSLTYSSEEQASYVARAIEPEVTALADSRSQVSLSREGPHVELHVLATDIVALRASLNTWLGLVSVAEQLSDGHEYIGRRNDCEFS